MVAPIIIGGIILTEEAVLGLGTLLGIQVWTQTPAGKQALASTANSLGKAITGAKEQGTSGVSDQVCTTCPPSKCDEIVEDLKKKNEKFKKDEKKYNPSDDWRGGHPFMAGGVLRQTVPGGHYRELRDLQRGLKNSLSDYAKNKCYDNAKEEYKITREAAEKNVSKYIELPPVISYIPL